MAWNATTRHMINLIFSDTTNVAAWVSSKVHSHWTVIQDIERGNLAAAVLKKIK